MGMPRFFRGGPVSADGLNQMANELDLQGLACKVRMSAPASAASSTDYVIGWGTEDYDTLGGGMWAAANPTYVVIREQGVYLMRAQLRIGSLSAGEAAGKIMVNTTNVLSTDPVASPRTSDKRAGSTVGEGVTLSMIAVEPLYAGDRIYTNVWQSSGATITTLYQNMGGTYLAVNRLSALV